VVQEVWSLSEGPFSFESSSVSQHSIQSLVDKAVVLMQSSVDTTLFFGGDVYLDHVVLHIIQLVVEELVASMQYLLDPTLLLKGDKSKELVSPTQYSFDPTPLI
jgi:hypothetical protein